jgi:beta-lactamase class A
MAICPRVHPRLSWLVALAVPGLMGAEPRAVEQALHKEAKAVPGRHAFLFAELTDKGPVPLYASGAKERFAIGSSFKLFILGALIDEVNKGKRRSEDVMLLRRHLIGPPSSELARWPVGSPATLHTYALKMMSISDNTATDHLIYLLGRRRIEAQMKVMGHTDPAVNRPLLSTREMVLLRDRKALGRADKWRKLDEAGRRKFLQTEFAGLHDYEAVDFDPAALDVAEWYATPLDMAHALDWIRRHTGPADAGRPLLHVLSVNTVLKFDRKTWPVVVGKGGSEDQLVCGNWLLKHKNGKWYTFHVYFNTDKDKLEPKAAIGVGQKMLAAIEAVVK